MGLAYSVSAVKIFFAGATMGAALGATLDTLFLESAATGVAEGR